MKRRESGYALLVVLLLFSMLALAIAIAVPSWTTEIRREREQASIDYARQYVMGIRRYYHKFGTYPPNLDRLKETDNVHYLRRAWPDPLSKAGKWRFLHAGDIQVPRPPGSQPGTGLEDLMQPNAPAPTSPAPSPASATGTGALDNFTGLPGTATAPGSSPLLGAPQRAAGGGLALPTVAFNGLPPLDGDVVGYFTLTPAAAARTSEVVGAPIIGVVSRNSQAAIHAFNGKDKPSDWLFVYDPAADRRGIGGPAATPAPNLPGQTPGPQPGNPGSTNPQGTSPGAL